jgi:hypothetical protein
MVRYFVNEATRPNRALQIWLILIGLAKNRQTITYGGLAKLLGYKGAGVFGDTLGHIMFYCKQNELPELTVLVIDAEGGVPMEPQLTPSFDTAREKVYKYDWYSIFPPSPDELKAAFDKGMKTWVRSGRRHREVADPEPT